MFKISVLSDEVVERSGQSQRTGKAYSLREQKAYAHLPSKPYPVEISLRLDDGQPAYQKGDYVLSPDSFYVGQFNVLSVRVRLQRPPAVARTA